MASDDDPAVWLDDDDVLDPITAAAGLVATTGTARLGVRLDLSRRPIAIAVKALTTLDVLSGGRLVVGVATEADADQLSAAFSNEFRPSPVQRPHPPVVVRSRPN